MKKITGIFLAIVLAVTLIACADKKEVPLTPLEPGIPVEPITPEEPVEDEIEDEVEDEIEDDEKDDLIFVEFTQDKGVFEKFDLDVTKAHTIVIRIKGESQYDIPVNFRNFRGDSDNLEVEGVEGTSYLVDHEFKIGSLDAEGRLINTHKHEGVTDIRLHTMHKTHGTVHHIGIDVSSLESFGFDFTVTTAAFAFIDGLEIEIIRE